MKSFIKFSILTILFFFSTISGFSQTGTLIINNKNTGNNKGKNTSNVKVKAKTEKVKPKLHGTLELAVPVSQDNKKKKK
jgi:hypothetical protein